MDQGSVQSGILKISLQILSPATVPDAVTSDLIPDPINPLEATPCVFENWIRDQFWLKQRIMKSI